jgi:hypothetical protein
MTSYMKPSLFQENQIINKEIKKKSRTINKLL